MIGKPIVMSIFFVTIKFIIYLEIMHRIYVDGIFDLFHRGHLESLRKAKNIKENVHLIVGVVSDENALKYKRQPIINHKDRIEIIKHIDFVDEVIEDAPLYLTKQFVEDNNIDLVVHGFSNEDDWSKQKDFFKDLITSSKSSQDFSKYV